jgi:hypothetical protein
VRSQRKPGLAALGAEDRPDPRDCTRLAAFSVRSSSSSGMLARRELAARARTGVLHGTGLARSRSGLWISALRPPPQIAEAERASLVTPRQLGSLLVGQDGRGVGAQSRTGYRRPAAQKLRAARRVDRRRDQAAAIEEPARRCSTAWGWVRPSGGT